MRIGDHSAALHEDDHWIDEICIVGEQPLVRLVTRYRYKTSDLSGNEWRTSAAWQCSEHCPMEGAEADERDPGWLYFDSGYSGRLEVGCAALYPGLYSSQRHAHGVEAQRIEFRRKGRILYASSFDGEPRPLLTLAGHLPWALIEAGDHPLGTDEAWNDMRRLCFQPGCREPAVSTYRLRARFDQRGHQTEADNQIRRFCPVHLRRGDCGLDDADANYEVVDGPGPEGAVGWKQYAREALRMVMP